MNIILNLHAAALLSSRTLATIDQHRVRNNLIKSLGNSRSDRDDGRLLIRERAFFEMVFEMRDDALEMRWTDSIQGCQMAKFDPFLSLDCARVEGVWAQGRDQILQRSIAEP